MSWLWPQLCGSVTPGQFDSSSGTAAPLQISVVSFGTNILSNIENTKLLYITYDNNGSGVCFTHQLSWVKVRTGPTYFKTCALYHLISIVSFQY